MPLDSALTGKLTPDTVFAEGDFQYEYFKGNRKQETFDHVQGIVEDLGIASDQVVEIALRYT